MIFTIICGLLLIAIIYIINKIFVVIPRRKKELEKALNDELNETIRLIDDTVKQINSRKASETNPTYIKALDAIASNYRYVTLFNLYTNRKQDFENRPDFNRKFVQKYYDINNSQLDELGQPNIIDITTEIPENILTAYLSASKLYIDLTHSKEISDSNGNTTLSPTPFFYLTIGNTPIISFSNTENQLVIYPTFAIIYKGGANIEFCALADILCNTYTTEYTEYDHTKSIPSDATFVGYKWQYMTKKGEPDARYSYNPRYTSYNRCHLSISPGTISLWLSNSLATQLFCTSLLLLKSENLNSGYKATVKLHTSNKSSANPSADILNSYIKQDPVFLDVLKYITGIDTISRTRLQRIFQIGFAKADCIFNWLKELDYIEPATTQLAPYKIKLSQGDLNNIIEIINSHKPKSSHYVGEKHPTKPWIWTEYAPGKFDWRTDKSQSKQDKKTTAEQNNSTKASEQLATLIGLSSVKKEVEQLTNFIKIQQIRKSKGLKTSPISYHCVFTGNPGTGKTTVARIIAKIYTELGILSKGHLIETDRSGLVAEYIGQTAVKTNNIIDSAIDGVLFIDEAYSLVPKDTENDFGHEAISTLLKRMEDNRDRLVVILAGYDDKMKDFIDSNPGLQSRFNRYIHFDDYSTDELIQIFELSLNKHDYKITDSAKQKLKTIIDKSVTNKDKNFGNARYIRNLFEKSIQLQATRLSTENNITEDKLQLIVDADIPE